MIGSCVCAWVAVYVQQMDHINAAATQALSACSETQDLAAKSTVDKVYFSHLSRSRRLIPCIVKYVLVFAFASAYDLTFWHKLEHCRSSSWLDTFWIRRRQVRRRMQGTVLPFAFGRWGYTPIRVLHLILPMCTACPQYAQHTPNLRCGPLFTLIMHLHVYLLMGAAHAFGGLEPPSPQGHVCLSPHVQIVEIDAKYARWRTHGTGSNRPQPANTRRKPRQRAGKLLRSGRRSRRHL